MIRDLFVPEFKYITPMDELLLIQLNSLESVVISVMSCFTTKT